MKNKNLFAATILALAATGAFAQAPAAANPAAVHVAPAAKTGQDLGTVTRDEYMKRAGERFDKLDGNKDGKLSAEERHAKPEGRAGAPVTREQFLQRAGLRFDLLDTNKDGKLNPDERHARPRKPATPVAPAAAAPAAPAAIAAAAPRH